MHELSIAQALVEQAEAARLANGGGKVIAVEVRVGEWRQVVPEILSNYFDYLSRGGPLEGARIDIDHVAATARCGACSLVYSLDDFFLICPSCGSRACELVSGQELCLVGLELEDD
jgi:hydrogenase nickel incorporation protein HypA/HybF